MPPRPGPAIRGPVARAIRDARRLSAMQVVAATEAAGHRIHPSTLSLIESGDRPGKPHVHTLAAALNVDPEVLTGQRPALRVLRDAAGLSATALAAEVGVKVGDLARMESGALLPDPHVAQRLAARLAVPISVIAPSDEGEAA